jgi:hypothetical protein
MAQAPPEVREVIQNLTDGGPRGDRRQLAASKSGRGDGTGSFRATLIKRACREHGHSLDEPGEIEQFYFDDEGVIAIKLDPED